MSKTEPDLANLVVFLSAKGRSQRSISKELGLSRNTVRGILDRVARQRSQGHTALPGKQLRPSKLDDFAVDIAELLGDFPDITAVRLHEELAGRGFDGGYTIVRERLRAVRPKPKAAPVERFETDPGRQGQQDWSPYTIDFTETGRQVVQAFGLILGYSRRLYLRFGLRSDFYTLIRQHKAAFDYFGGVPVEILYDGQKAVVLRREGPVSIYNPRFLVFATHYGFRPQDTRRPQLKGKKERSFLYVVGNLLNARTFRDLDHLNEVAAWWLEHRADVRDHGTTGERPIDRFVIEAPHLLPLPARPFDDAEVGYRVVSVEGTVAWDGTPYTVPYEQLLDIVAVRATADEVIVYASDLREIARHPRAPRGTRELVEDAAHRPPKRQPRHDPDLLTLRLAEIDDAGAAFAAGVVRKQRYRGAHLARVLALREKYATDDLVAALQRAVDYRAFDSKVIERILQASATPRVLPDSAAVEATARLREAVRSTSPRPLQAYEAALRGSNSKEDRP